MKFSRKILLSAAAIVATSAVAALAADAPDWEALGKRWWGHVQFLADDALEGRDVGSQGFAKAADYVTEQFKKVGLEPAGASGYAQPVAFNVSKVDEEASSLELLQGTTAESVEFGEEAFFVSHSDGSTQFEAPAVFVGYGLSVPELKYDDLAGQKLNGKVVVYVSGGPASMGIGIKAHAQSRDERLKALRSAGAIGTITIPNPK